MKRTLAHILLALTLTIVVFVGIAKCHIGQIRRKQWEANRDIIVVVVRYGAGIDQYGYYYKPDWMPIQEYREEIKKLNNMNNCTLYEGQELKLYVVKEGNQNA